VNTMQSPVLIAAVTLLAGCTVGPDPHDHPIATVPAQFVEATVGEMSEAGDGATSSLVLADPGLQMLIATGLARNDDIRIAAARVAESRALLGVSEADMYPSVDAVGIGERRRQSGNIDQRDGDGFVENRFGLGFQSVWEIDLWGRVRRSVEAATFDSEQALALYTDARRSVAAEIAAEYVQARGLQARLDVAGKGVRNQEQLAALTEALAKDGSATTADLRRIHARLERTRASIPPLEAGIRISVQRLSVLSVLSANEVSQILEQSAGLPRTPVNAAFGLPSMLLRHRPDVRAAEASLSAATARIGVATAELFPRVVLNGDFGVSSSEAGKLFSGDSLAFGVGPSVRWPVLDFGRVRSQIRAQGARQEAAIAAYEQTVRRAVAEVESSLADRRGAIGERDRLELAATASSEAMRLIQLRYEQGADPLLAVLDAERERLEIEEQLAIAQTRLLLSHVAIVRAIGEFPERTQPEFQVQSFRALTSPISSGAAAR
jgi:outer membrane protein, multidrug efflux system